jgi:hypothetical protein
MGKKGQAPKHIQQRKGENPQPNLRLIRALENIEDPRGPSCNFIHPLTTVLFITVVCSLCGADDWEVIVIQARAMVGWLKQFVDIPLPPERHLLGLIQSPGVGLPLMGVVLNLIQPPLAVIQPRELSMQPQ